MRCLSGSGPRPRLAALLQLLLLLCHCTGYNSWGARNHYTVLGVGQHATTREIIKAYRKLALEWHPDRNKRPGAEARFVEIANAYETLKDPDEREEYDTGEPSQQKQEQQQRQRQAQEHQQRQEQEQQQRQRYHHHQQQQQRRTAEEDELRERRGAYHQRKYGAGRKGPMGPPPPPPPAPKIPSLYSVPITDASHGERVLRSGKIWVLQFYTDASADSSTFSEVWDDVAKELKGYVNFGRVDTRLNSVLTWRYNVKKLPAVVLVADGKFRTMVGGGAPGGGSQSAADWWGSRMYVNATDGGPPHSVCGLGGPEETARRKERGVSHCATATAVAKFVADSYPVRCRGLQSGPPAP
eukprot:SAG22_NODE_25_length_30107_cov_28.456412_17_plen_354_part_00